MIVVVLGMHRSGTSVASRSLKVFGIEHGNNLYMTGSDNAKGHWEDQDLMDLNERILGSIHSEWHSVRLIPSEAWEDLASGELMNAAAELIRRRLDENVNYGCKDPRLTLLLPFWDRVFSRLGLDVKYVLCLRNPLDVACSLRARDGFGFAKGIFLWTQYMMTAITVLSSQSRGFLVVSYEDTLADPSAQLACMSRFLGLPIIESESRSFVAEFLDPSLRHHSGALSGKGFLLPSLARDVYDFLCECSCLRRFCFTDVDRARIESLGLRSKDVCMLLATVSEQEDEFGVCAADLAAAQSLAVQAQSQLDRAYADLRRVKASVGRQQHRLSQSQVRVSAARLRLGRAEKKLAHRTARFRVLLRKLRVKRMKLSAIRSSRTWLMARAIEKSLRLAEKFLMSPLRLFASKRQ